MCRGFKSSKECRHLTSSEGQQSVILAARNIIHLVLVNPKGAQHFYVQAKCCPSRLEKMQTTFRSLPISSGRQRL